MTFSLDLNWPFGQHDMILFIFIQPQREIEIRKTFSFGKWEQNYKEESMLELFRWAPNQTSRGWVAIINNQSNNTNSIYSRAKGKTPNNIIYTRNGT